MSIMIKNFMRGIFIPLIITVIITLIPQGTETFSQNTKTGSIKINILSKHLRRMSDIGAGELNFTFPSGTVIRYDDSELYTSSLKIIYSGGHYNISAKNRPLYFKNCIIYSSTTDGSFRTEIKGNKRTYPLPLELIHYNNSLKIYITENIEQYAIDSSCAEFGYLDKKNHEALYALALAIHGRCRIESLKKKHKDCDFCDLTCCQSYQGRSGLNPISGPFIDIKNLNCGLFFHSSSGGKLFSESVFNSGVRKIKPPVDILYSENLKLSRTLHTTWEARIATDELSALIFSGGRETLRDIKFNTENEIIFIQTDSGENIIAPEDFRLKINRKKGWNFIKSNNYSIRRDGITFIFTGSGLGHCTGMSLDGAIELASKGYSRYEILEHYYPNLKYITSDEKSQTFQYVT